MLSKFWQVNFQENRTLEMSRRKWENDIRIDLKQMSINTRNWVDSAHVKDYWRALVNAALNLRVP